MSQVWDFLVAGAGPAGCRAAELLARHGANVLLLDPKAPWEKPCGGGLSAAALRNTPDLAELASQWEPLTDVLVVAPGGASVVLPLRHPLAVVSRLALARWGLERATGAGATFAPGAVRSMERVDGSWRMTDGGGRTYQARWLLGADGAASRVRAALAPRLAPELAPARVVHAAGAAPPGVAVLLLFPQSDGYLWDFPRRGLHSVGVAVGPATFGRQAMDAMISRYLDGSRRDHDALSLHGAAIPTRRRLASRLREFGSQDYALLGDAAGLADPLTGEGIDAALRSATLAVQTFDQHLGFERYPPALVRALRPDGVRTGLLRKLVYRSGVVERLVQNAVRPGLARETLCALMDAVNEHGSLTEAAWRILTRRRGRPRGTARPLVPAPAEAPAAIRIAPATDWASPQEHRR